MLGVDQTWYHNHTAIARKARFSMSKILLLKTYVMFCASWHHLYNLKNVENIHGGVFLSVKFHAFSLQLY